MPNIIVRQATPVEEEEDLYDEIPIYKSMTQDSNSQANKNILENISNDVKENIEEEEEDIYDELATTLSKENQQKNNIPQANIQIDEELNDDYLVPKKSPELFNYQINPEENEEEENIYDDLANVASQPIKQLEKSPVKPKIYNLQKVLFRSKTPEKVDDAKKKIVLTNEEIKESPGKLNRYVLQDFERKISFNKR